MMSYFQGGGHDFRSPLLYSVCQLPASPPNARDVIGSLYALQHLIHSTFVLVTTSDTVRSGNVAINFEQANLLN